MIGKQIGDFEILGVIGEGGMGKVYLAKNVHLPSFRVALKTLLDESQKERFLREADTLTMLDHSNICQIRHFFNYQDKLLIAMQYIEGESLASMLESGKMTSISVVREIFIRVLDALSYAHGLQVYHRDIKPANIMIDKNKTVKIIDFGIARRVADAGLTATGAAIGSVRYMAPEQFTSEHITDFTLCDIYAVGISLYETCCGEPPFKDTSPFVLKDKHCRETPVNPRKLNPKISKGLSQIIMKAIEKKPSRRFKSAAHMRDALQFLPPESENDRSKIEAGPEVEAGRSTNRDSESSHAATTFVTRIGIIESWLKIGRNHPKLLLGIAVIAIASCVLFGFYVAHLFRPTKGVTFSPQIISEGEVFTPVNISELVRQQTGKSVKDVSNIGGKHLRTRSTSQEFVFEIDSPKGWYGSDTINFAWTTTDGMRDSASAVYTVNRANAAPVLKQPEPIQMFQGQTFEPIRLDHLVSDAEDSVRLLTWEAKNTENLTVHIGNNGAANISAKSGWHGKDSILVIVSDTHGRSDSAFINCELLQADRQESREVASTLELKLSVIPEDCLIYDQNGRKYSAPLVLRAGAGSYVFQLYSLYYPIYRATISLNSASVDTTINLRNIGRNKDGTVAVSVLTTTKDGTEVLGRNLVVNRFMTRHVSTDSMRTLRTGSYEVRVDLSSDYELDSVLVNRKYNGKNWPIIDVHENSKVLVAFWVTKR